MTAYDPQLWGRKAAVILNDDLSVVGGPHTNRVVLIRVDNFLTNCASAVTSGDINQIQADGGDLRATSDEAGTTQLPLWVMRIALSGTPASSAIFAWVVVPSVTSGSTDTIYLRWLTAGATTPEAVDGTYGREAVFSGMYEAWYGMQEDPAAGEDFIDWCGNWGNFNPGNDGVRGDDGIIDKRCTDIGSADDLTISYTPPNGWGFAFFAETAAGGEVIVETLETGDAAHSRIFVQSTNAVRAYTDGVQIIETVPPVGINHWQFTQNNSSGFRKLFRAGAQVASDSNGGALGEAVTFSMSSDSDSSLAHLRYYSTEMSADALATEHAMLVGAATFSEVQTPSATAATAVLTCENCPAGYRLEAYSAPGQTEPHGSQFDAIGSTSAGTNTLSGSVTGYIDLFVTLVGDAGFKIWQGYVQLPSTGLTVDFATLLQDDPVFKAGLATLTDGVEFDLTPGTKTIGINSASPGRRLYLSAKKAYLDSATLCASLFPIAALERAWLRIFNGWNFASGEEQLVTACGIDRVLSTIASTVQEEQVGNRSLGDLTGCTVYYSIAGGAATALSASGSFDEPIVSYTIGGDDFRSDDVVFFARRWGYLFDLSSVSLVGGDLTEPAAFAHALDTSTVDPNIVDSVANVDANTPFTSMGVTSYTVNKTGNSVKSWAAEAHVVNDLVQSAAGRWFICTGAGTSAGDDTDLAGGSDTVCTWSAYSGEREVTTGNWYAYYIVIDGASGSPAQVHTWAQRRLLFDGATPLQQTPYGSFVDGRYTTSIGVFVDSVSGNVTHTDLTGAERVPPDTVTLSVTCIDEDGAPISGAAVRFEAGATGPETQGTVLLSGTTNGSGVVQTSYLYTATQSIQNAWARKGTLAPFYKQAIINGPITETGLAVTVTMVSDD